MYYECKMIRETTFLLKADNEDDALEWLYTHTADDVEMNVDDYTDDYSEEIVDHIDNVNETTYMDYVTV